MGNVFFSTGLSLDGFIAGLIVMVGGTITADKLEGPLKGRPLSELAVAGANGSLYINIHTERNPNGEIRGQIVNPTD
jgi:hypothetical protein